MANPQIPDDLREKLVDNTLELMEILDTMVALTDEAVLTLKDGRVIRQIDEDELDGDLFFRFQRVSIKHKDKPDEAMKWLVMRMFTIEGQPLTIDHMTEKPSAGGLGFRTVAHLCNIAGKFVEGLPNPKTASTSADSPDGDLLN